MSDTENGGFHKLVSVFLTFLVVGVLFTLSRKAKIDYSDNGAAIGWIVVMIIAAFIITAIVNALSDRGAEWVSSKIIAPVIVGLVIGGISFLITGNFATSGGISLVGSIITFVITQD
ncbi:MAG: hypothetical protein R2824_12745 [Saprospiraceae bacterium]|nr:hypothetical protein [Lewinella sp.]